MYELIDFMNTLRYKFLYLLYNYICVKTYLKLPVFIYDLFALFL